MKNPLGVEFGIWDIHCHFRTMRILRSWFIFIFSFLAQLAIQFLPKKKKKDKKKNK